MEGNNEPLPTETKNKHRNQRKNDKMKIKTNIKSGQAVINHNERIARSGLKVRTSVRAGVGSNHNERLARG